MNSVATSIRRLWRHLTRSQARVGWVIALGGIASYGLYRPDWPAADAIKQFGIVIASVALGAVFLPELSSNLWTIKEDEVRGLIPDDRVRELEASLVRAQTREVEWADKILGSALRPLLDVGKTPHKIIGDLAYTANIHPNENVSFNGRSMRIHLVETTLRGRRVLPPSGQHSLYWVSILRTEDQLEAEFNQDACLFREVVELDATWSDDEWRAAVQALSSSRIVLDGVTLEASTEPPPGHVHQAAAQNGVVRWYFSSVDIADERERKTITLALDYPMTTNRLTVVFGAYYTMGSAQVIVRIYDKTESLRIQHDFFFGRALGTSPVDVSSTTKPGLCKQISVITSDDSLLWPGSGLSVWWTNTEVDEATALNPRMKASHACESSHGPGPVIVSTP